MMIGNHVIEKDIELEVALFPSFALNLNKKVVYWNDLSEKTFGYSLTDFTDKNISLKNTLFSLLPDNIWDKIFSTKGNFHIDNLQLITKKDIAIDCSLITVKTNYANEPVILFLCILNDKFNQIDFSKQELIDLKNGLLSSFMIVTISDEGFITNCNEHFLKTSHWTPKRVLGKTFWQLFPEREDNIDIVNNIWETITSGQVWKGDVEKITKDGVSYWVHLTAIPTTSTKENAYNYILIEQDITNEKNLQHKLEKIAYIDAETGLMNGHRLEKVVKELVEEGRHFYFVYLSIDKYYTLKELHNEGIENNLINEFTKRLKIYFQDSLMARINEYDFVVITPLGEWFIQGFLTYLKQNPIYNGSSTVPISVSGGITRSPQDQSTFAQLMKASQTIISNVRQYGGDNIVTLSDTSHKELNRKAIIEKQLLLALNQNNLKVLYQPQFNLASGKITAVEALVRWEDEEIGVISPEELIPIAEQSGLINNIGSFVIEQACSQAAKWHKQGLDIKVGINLSVREFREKNMAKAILAILNKTECPANLIQIEITEKFALEAEAEKSIINQMRILENEGITFVLDDFGTGYASFRYMQLLPIGMLKIDKAFIHSLIHSDKTQQLLNGMIQFGKSMNLTVLAEGVETEEQKKLLEQLGCDAIQGFLISHPVNEEGIAELITK